MKYFLFAAALFFGLAWAQDNPVSVSIRAFVINEDGTFTETTTAEGGDTVEYRVTATNTDETTLPPGTVAINGPVPESSTYVVDSASESSDYETEFSSDGSIFEDVEVSPVQQVRWTLLDPFEPGAAIDVIYRVTINGGSASSSESSGSAAAFTQSMFGHLGVIEFECPETLRQSETVQTICGQAFDDFGLFRQKWDLYADYEGEVPLIPEPVTAWKAEDDSYSRKYTINGLPYFIRYSTVGDSQGLATAIYPR